jgi:hypothetical protein
MACRAVARLKIKPASALRASARQPLPPADEGGEGWWEVLVMLQLVASSFV